MLKVVLQDAVVAKVDARTLKSTFSGEEMRRITVTFKDGVRWVMRDGSVEFQRIGLFLKQGDVVSGEFDDFDANSFKPEEDKDRTIKLKDVVNPRLETLVVTAGLWDEKPIEGLEGRSALTSFAPPRESSAPPVSGAGQFSAPAPDAAAPPVTGTATNF